MEIAMKLLEKDTHEKQDTLVALRQQLEEVKAINLQMFHKVQVGAGSVSPSPPGFLLLPAAGAVARCLSVPSRPSCRGRESAPPGGPSVLGPVPCHGIFFI